MEQTKRATKWRVLPAAVERDEDSWRASVPGLEAHGCATHARTPKEALRNLEDVAQRVVEDLLEYGEALPQAIIEYDHPVVVVNCVGPS